MEIIRQIEAIEEGEEEEHQILGVEVVDRSSMRIDPLKRKKSMKSKSQR